MKINTYSLSCKKKKMYPSFVILLFIMFCSFRSLPTSETNSRVIQVADSQMGAYLAKIEPGKEGNYGFTEKDDLDLCSVGKPYRLIAFNRAFYDEPLADNTDYITIQNKWLVPIVLNKQNKVLLAVDGNPGNLNVSGMGNALLAQELGQKSIGAGDSDEFYLLRIPSLSADFFVHENNNSFSEAKFVPMESALTFIPALMQGKVYTLDEIQHIVKDALTKTVK